LIKHLFSETIAWYKSGGFSGSTWPDASGTGNTATLSGSGLTTLLESGHGVSGNVLSLVGTINSKISLGNIIKEQFTVCSVTRYTGGSNQRILQGERTNWLHGHWSGSGGVAFYDGWKTSKTGGDSLEDTDWVIMCGTNAESQLKLVNGVDVGTVTGGSGINLLCVNDGIYDNENSDFVIAELVVLERGLTTVEMTDVSLFLLDKFTVAPSV
jgi:hypothetical protein